MSDFDKLREVLTSWPAIIIGFVIGGWPGFFAAAVEDHQRVHQHQEQKRQLEAQRVWL
ncbi:MAG: hypothetical protein LIO78_01230 [Clostridiales bacterium]|nr:hypothetical protein [Clostridiales bacterium]